MKKRKLTPEEKARLKSIWQRTCGKGDYFSRYDMNFVLSFIREDSDLIEQALDIKKEKKK